MTRILLMEDDDELAQMLGASLAEQGYAIERVRTGTIALDRLCRETFDLLITDIFIRDGDDFVPDGGITLISRIRLAGRKGDAPHLKTMPILAMSGGAHIPGGYDPLRLARDLGASAWLRKPVSMHEILDAVEVLLDSGSVAAS